MAELLTSSLAVLGGVCMGTYPIFVKTSRVLAAKIHPAVFQGYKSTWVAIMGGAFVLWRVLQGQQPAYTFTWWGVLSAMAWVPAGSCLVAAVPRAGVGGAVLIFDGCTTLFSFLIAILVFQEPLKAHRTADGAIYYLAPYYLAGALVGMAGLVLLPEWLKPRPPPVHRPASYSRKAKVAAAEEPLLPAEHSPRGATSGSASIESAGASSVGSNSPVPPVPSRASIAFGYLLAVLAGAFSALQYALVTQAKAAGSAQLSPSDLESRNALGSWTLTFGMGALVINAAGILAVEAVGQTTSSRQHDSVLDVPKALVILVPASAAGLCYCWSMILTTVAVQRGGNAIVLAQRNAASLVTSGLWGLCYYRELSGLAAGAWSASAALTMLCVVLLGLEKGSG